MRTVGLAVKELGVHASVASSGMKSCTAAHARMASCVFGAAYNCVDDVDVLPAMLFLQA